VKKPGQFLACLVLLQECSHISHVEANFVVSDSHSLLIQPSSLSNWSSKYSGLGTKMPLILFNLDNMGCYQKDFRAL
jgi:hypothetical protein